MESAFVLSHQVLTLGDVRVTERLARALDSMASRDKAGNYVFEKGLSASQVTALMNASPRGFYLMVKHGLIPGIIEDQAIRMIYAAGLAFEKAVLPIAKVRRVEPAASSNLLLLLLERRRAPRQISKTHPERPKTVRL